MKNQETKNQEANTQEINRIDWEGLDIEIADENGLDLAEAREMLCDIARLPKKTPCPGFIPKAMERWDVLHSPLSRKRAALEKLSWRHMLSVAVQRSRFAVTLGILLYAAAFMFIYPSSGRSDMTMVAASGIPFVFGMVFSFFQWRFGMLELIKSCRLSLAKVITARVCMLFFVNFAVNIVATVIMAFLLEQSLDVFVRMTMLWCVPFFTTVSVCVLLCNFVYSSALMMACMGVLPMITFALITIKPIQALWLGQHSELLLVETVVALMAVILSFRSLSYFMDRKVFDYGTAVE